MRLSESLLALALTAALAAQARSGEVTTVTMDGATAKGGLTAGNQNTTTERASDEALLAQVQAGATEPGSGKTTAKAQTPAVFQPQAQAVQKGLPDNVMDWMSRRYPPKVLLGMKWQNPEKARASYVTEWNAPALSGLAPGSRQPGKPGQPRSRLEILPMGESMDADSTSTSYAEIRFRRPGGLAAWNFGYISYSEKLEASTYDFSVSATSIDTYESYKSMQNEAAVAYASLGVYLDVEAASFYAFAGPAVASYDYTEEGTTLAESDLIVPPFTTISTPGVIDLSKSGTKLTWVAGLGYSVNFGRMGLFAEYKSVRGSGPYKGLDAMGAGISIGF